MGNALALMVQVRGYKKILWSKDGKQLNISLGRKYVMDKDGTLHIMQITPHDGGFYKVQAINEAGSVYAQIQVFVTGGLFCSVMNSLNKVV